MAKVEVYQGEAKLLPFRIKNRKTGKALNLTGANFLLWVKEPEDTDPVIVKTNSDFDVAGVASGYVTVFLSIKDTFQDVGVYAAELKIVTADSPPQVEKLPFEFEVLEAITPNNFAEVIGLVSLEAFGDPIVTNL
jgi:hypothetical protein